jgi:hypothetical protein
MNMNRRKMSRAVWLAVSLVVAAVLTPAVRGEWQKHLSYAFGKKYTVAPSEVEIARSPAWKKDAENPPLSARKALELANAKKDALVKDGKDYAWYLDSLSLHPGGDDKWYWLAHYLVRHKQDSTGPGTWLRLMVLMDGTVVEPKATDVR